MLLGCGDCKAVRCRCFTCFFTVTSQSQRFQPVGSLHKSVKKTEV